MKQLSIIANMLIEEVLGKEKILYRILWTDGVVAFVIDINNEDKGLPYIKIINDIKWAVHQNKAHLIDGELARFIKKRNISPAERDIRNENYKIIEELVNNVPDIFYRNKRGPLVAEVATRFNKSVTTVFSLLRRYWRGGQTQDALIPNNEAKGGKGKDRRSGSKKRGAPRDVGEGINISDQDRVNIEKALKKYYYKENGFSLKDTHLLMLRDSYRVDIRFDDRGRQWVILDDVHSGPSYHQFYYWYKKLRNDEEEVRTRKGENYLQLYGMPRLGSSTASIFGPGAEFQIDSTIADLYLVSSYNPHWIIGRPIVYIVIDVFSQMIVGLYVGLEGPSWIAQASAIANSVSDKNKYCSKYGVSLLEDEWPCHHLPRTIFGDRGETKSKSSEKLSTQWGVNIEVAAPYRPDWKGLIEGQFNFINGQKIKPLLPGAVTKEQLAEKRKGAQYRLDAILTLEEFTEVMISFVRKFNKRYLKSYELDQEMIEQQVIPRPIDLWNWGVVNRPNALREIPEDLVKLSLMPTDQATITGEGIRYAGLRYTSVEYYDSIRYAALKNQSKKIEICYDPRNMNNIYIPSEDGRAYAVCTLLEKESRYLNRSLWDIRYSMKYYTIEHKKQLQEISQDESDHISTVEQIVERAKKRLNEAPAATVSNAKKIREIPKNRRHEKELNRRKEAFNLDDEVDLPTAPISEVTDDSHLLPDQETSTKIDKQMLLRKMQKELKNAKKEG